jgi:hypothetical protein
MATAHRARNVPSPRMQRSGPVRRAFEMSFSLLSLGRPTRRFKAVEHGEIAGNYTDEKSRQCNSKDIQCPPGQEVSMDEIMQHRNPEFRRQEFERSCFSQSRRSSSILAVSCRFRNTLRCPPEGFPRFRASDIETAVLRQAATLITAAYRGPLVSFPRPVAGMGELNAVRSEHGKNSVLLFSPIEWHTAQDFLEDEVGPMFARQQSLRDLRREVCAL